MPTYTRTAKGNAIALNPQLPLPRNLRNLLMAIDGRPETLVSRMAMFEDVERLLASLLKDGLIRITSTNAESRDLRAAARPAEPDPTWADTDPDFMGSDYAHSLLGGANSAFGSGSSDPSSHPAGGVSSWDELRATHSSSFPPNQSRRVSPTGRQGAAASTAQHQLHDAISLISDFVSQHLPAHSIEVILTFESLGSVEQILSHLKAYEKLISPLGKTASLHFAQLRKVLTSS